MKFLLILFTFPFLTSLYNDRSYDLLEQTDWDLMQSDSYSAQLSSTLTDPEQWESFNIWQCFESRDLEIYTSGVNYDGEDKVIPAMFNSNVFPLKDFALYPEMHWRAKEIVKKWKKIINESESICIYGAKLPNANANTANEIEPWYIERIKTDNGYWSIKNEKEYQDSYY